MVPRKKDITRWRSFHLYVERKTWQQPESRRLVINSHRMRGTNWRARRWYSRLRCGT